MEARATIVLQWCAWSLLHEARMSMRYGVLADVHGNAFALRTALDSLAAAGVDGWLCAGDIVGYGPQPNECVDLLVERDVRCVAGNHELLVLGRLQLDDSGRLARETTPWTRSVLTEDSRRYLAALPATVRLPGLLMAHGSVADARTYVREETQARDQLREMRRLDAGAEVLVLGHTHRQWMFGESSGTVPIGSAPAPLPTGGVLLNPGSVGQSRETERVPRARFLLLDLERRHVRFFVEPYDVQAALAALRQHGLPRSCLHVPRGRVRAIPRRAGTLMRYACRRVGGPNLVRRRTPEAADPVNESR
jgi:predicted phosphodiesterase